MFPTARSWNLQLLLKRGYYRGISHDALIVGYYAKPPRTTSESSTAHLDLATLGLPPKLSQKLAQHLLDSKAKGSPGELRMVHESEASGDLAAPGPGSKNAQESGFKIPKHICLVGLGAKKSNYTSLEKETDAHGLFLTMENARKAVATGVRALKELQPKSIGITGIPNEQVAAEGAQLGSYEFQQFKVSTYKPAITPAISMLESRSDLKGSSDSNTGTRNDLFEQGKIYGQSQNIARTLAETPANYLTPEMFAAKAQSLFSKLPVTVEVRDLEWIKQHQMGGLLAVSQGSASKPVFLELHYQGKSGGLSTRNGDHHERLVLVGKGVTFDSGGISIKPSQGMGDMKGDMGGAAAVVAAIHGIASLGMELDVTCLVPLCENMPSGTALKPGDVIYASNGKSIEVDNTDAEGRLILADALHYAHQFHPKYILDVATLTGAICVALGPFCSGVFTPSKELFSRLEKAGTVTGDRVWRMPIWPDYRELISSDVADIKNAGSRDAGSCTAALFLKEFVGGKTFSQQNAAKDTSSLKRQEFVHWAHIDIAGVMSSKATSGYDVKGMSGRPTRMLIEFAKQLLQPVSDQ